MTSTGMELLPPRTRVFRLDADGEMEKHCSGCGEWWPADTDFFSPAPSKTLGLDSWCKACQAERNQRRRANGELATWPKTKGNH